MIVTETVTLNGAIFTHTYSDNNLKIRKAGTDEVYDEAYDVSGYEYEETDIEKVIEPINETADMQAALELLGVEPTEET